jgi:hypothetical protein
MAHLGRLLIPKYFWMPVLILLSAVHVFAWEINESAQRYYADV